MKALIIAAGDGTRLRPFTKRLPKPLVPLLGLKLIERVILSAKEAGIKEFVIVLGYKGGKIKELLKDGSGYKVKISYLKNKDWRKENGVSVFCARSLLKEPFLLLMSDHIFDPKVLSRFLKLKVKPGEGILCLDTNLEKIFNLEDATKVRFEKGKALAIGKELKDFNGVDTGIFLLTPTIFEILEKNIAQGKYSLTEAIRVLAQRKRMRVWRPRNFFWVDIDDFSDLSFAKKALLRSLVKKEDGVLSRNLNRKISTFLSRFLVRTPLTPTQISLFHFLIGILSVFFFAQGRYPQVAIGGILAQLASVLDGCDGEVARLRFLASSFGAWFDDSLDRYLDSLIILGASFGYWRQFGGSFIWIVGFFALMGVTFLNYFPAKYYKIAKKKLKVGSFGFKRDVRLFLVMLGGVLNQVFFVLVLLAVFSNLISLGRLILASKD